MSVLRKADEIYLEVRTSNDAAIKMYERINFQTKSRLRSYYRDGEDAYLMALESILSIISQNERKC